MGELGSGGWNGKRHRLPLSGGSEQNSQDPSCDTSSGGGATWGIPDVEPGLPNALASLSKNQRVAVTLIIGFGWKLQEVAELLGVSKSTVQSHIDRGMKKLRARIGEAS